MRPIAISRTPELPRLMRAHAIDSDTREAASPGRPARAAMTQDAPSAAIERPDVMALRWATAIAALASGIVLLIMWAPYTLFSGFPYETAFPYMSETGATFLTGFLYTADPLRIHTNTFYHLAYLLGEAVGAGGSYVPHQIVHAALWWARGFLVFLLVRKFFPQALMAAYIAGALVIVHASDGACSGSAR